LRRLLYDLICVLFAVNMRITRTLTATHTSVVRGVTTHIATDGTTIAIGVTAGIMDRITTDIITTIPTTTDGDAGRAATTEDCFTGTLFLKKTFQIIFNKVTQLKDICRKRLELSGF